MPSSVTASVVDAAATERCRSGPVFICGRQYSGNTLMTLIFQRMPGCFAITDEGNFFEHRHWVDRMGSGVQRAQWMAHNLKLDDPKLVDATARWLADWVIEHPNADGLATYREAMRYLTETTGNAFWAQKATSYAFYALEILSCMPDARMIYLLRNPFDLCASAKRRTYEREAVVSRTLGWNGGVNMIERAVVEFPGRIHVVKYEELVHDPRQSTESLCCFLGVPYREDLLEVPHINPSEDHFKVVPGSQGINQSRLYYYMNELSPTEIVAVEMLAAKALLRKHYPDLPHNTMVKSITSQLAAVWRIASGLCIYSIDRVRWARRTNTSFIRRTFRRLRAMKGRRN